MERISRWTHWLLCAITISVFVAGCQRTPSDSSSPDIADPSATTDLDTNSGGAADDGRPSDWRVSDSATARQLLAACFEHYRAMHAYQDETIITVRYTGTRDTVTEETRLNIHFIRPNRLRLEVRREDNQVIVRSDGSAMSARVIDPTTHNFDGQQVMKAASDLLTTADIYSVTEYADPASPNQMPSLLMAMPITLDFLQLGLLTSDKSFSDVFPDDVEITFGKPQSIDNHLCQMIAVNSDAGQFHFGVDRTQGVIRRIDFPTQRKGEPTQNEMSVEFRQIRQDIGSDESRFQADQGEDIHNVGFFVLPPLPLPTQFFGQPITDFQFVNQNGKLEPVPSGHTALALAWFTRDDGSRVVLQELEQLQTSLSQHGVDFLAICSEPVDQLDNTQLSELMQQWRIKMPVVRDLQGTGLRKFNVQAAPTVVILDAQNRLQLFEVGANPQLSQSVQFVLQSVLQGNNLGAEVVRRFQEEQHAYQRQRKLAEAAVQPAMTAAPTEVAPEATQPKKMTLTPAWTQTNLDSPGNLLVEFDADEKPTGLLVLESGRSLVRLDLAGQVLERRPLPADFLATNLVPFQTSEHESFIAVFARFGSQVRLLDGQLETILTYPEQPNEDSRIEDILLEDLDKDGSVELLVAWSGELGVHCVERSGERRWSFRGVPNVISLAKERTLAGGILLTSQDGAVTPVNVFGKQGQRMAIGKRTIHHLQSTSTKSLRPTEYIGLAYTIEGRQLALGLNRSLNELWSYGLPEGTYQSQVNVVRSVNLLAAGNPHWLLVGPDGSIHLVADDGSFYDSFRMGHYVSGATGLVIEGKSVLVLATPSGLTALQVEFEN